MSTTTAVAPAVGAIFINSWGWGQTNVDFYQVVRLTAHTAWLRQLQTYRVSSAPGDMSGTAHAITDEWYAADLLQKRIQHNKRGCVFFSMEYGLLIPWDGTPQFCSWWY